MEDFSQRSFNETLAELNTSAQGLSAQESESRREHFGLNRLSQKRENTLLRLIQNQLTSPLVFILIIAGFVAFALGEKLDAIVIFAVFILNFAIGFIQEDRASQAFEKLRESQERTADVLRNRRRKTVSSEEIVPGDIVVLEAGMHVPADIRLGSVQNFMVNESPLTGESRAIEKTSETLEQDHIISDKTNMVWMGTLVESGTGRGVVVATGNDTELGHIATHLTKTKEGETPIQKRVATLARAISASIAAIVILIFLLGLSRGEAITEILLIAVTVAVAVLPEGLPAAVTIVLALGMEAILKKGGLVRNLLAAETLGSTTTILTDKTGTLTEAQMSLTSLITTSDLDNPPPQDHSFSDEEQELLRGAIRASDAYITENDSSEQTIKGRPMEKAIVQSGLEHDLYSEAVSDDFQRVDLLPFESKNRFAASLNEHPSGNDGEHRIYVTGAPEILLDQARTTLQNAEEVPLSEDVRDKFTAYLEELSSMGRRFIALAYKNTDIDSFEDMRDEPEQILDNVVFVGLMAFHDPVREDVPEAIKLAREAGVDIKMLTGDHPDTARAIATEVGLVHNSSRVIHGKEIGDLSDKELYELLRNEYVFARVLPEQKLRMSRILKSRGEVVAMTGDGINDAPALRNADIGIALGTGTEVAKEASDLILLTNSFSIITRAIEEGRRIIDNLRKIATFMLATNLSELLILVSALLLTLPLPLLPTQILWVNIIGQGLLDFALAFEPAEKGIMKRDPREVSSGHIITKKLISLVIIVGVVTSAALLGLFIYLLQTSIAIEHVRTMMFIALALSSFFFAFSFKSLSTPVWREHFFENKFLVISLLISIGLLFVSLTYPPLQTLFTLTPLTLAEFGLLAAFGIVNLFLIETVKFFVFFTPKQN